MPCPYVIGMATSPCARRAAAGTKGMFYLVSMHLMGEGGVMPKYLFQGSYIGEGLKGLATEGGTPRVEAARQLFGSLGGTLEC